MPFKKPTDYNKLGQIYEASLEKYRRKRGGIFYTPNHITKYIVENTIGKLCQNKKVDLQISDKKTTPEQLEKYQNWLLELTICDPACGAGAFLNQAYEFLIYEHQFILKLGGKNIDYEYFILKNNLFGVDINEESVEIAQLSLWLHTARRGRTLTTLSNNIKCGNSLIDDPKIAGEKAFDWKKEFPQIFENGGFDVVIGNPPYVTHLFSDSIKNFLRQNYDSAQYQLDFYVAFMEKAEHLLKHNGYISYITPNSWLKNIMFDKCRAFLLDNFTFKIIIPNIENIFLEASVDTSVYVATKLPATTDNQIDIGTLAENDYQTKHQIYQQRFAENEGYIFDVSIKPSLEGIFKKIDKNAVQLASISQITRGINPYDKYTGQSPKIIQDKAYHATYKKDETFVPDIRGKHVSRYLLNWDGQSYVSYGDWLAAPRNPKFFTGNRVICRQVLGKYINCTFTNEDYVIDQSVFIAKFEDDTIHPKFVLAQLTSKLVVYYFKYKANEFDALFPKIKIREYRQLPIRVIADRDQQPFIQKADQMLLLNSDFQKISSKFLKLLQSSFSIPKVSKKLQKWHELEFEGFLKELKKAKVKVSLADKSEWMDFFEAEKTKVQTLQSEIQKVDSEIDQMVYQLYGLTEEEIKIVENY